MEFWINKDGKYVLSRDLVYYNQRYNKMITAPKGYISNGADFAIDIASKAWWIHDLLKETERFDDGTRCTNKQASQILSDILNSEGRWIRAQYWYTATYLYGEFKKLTS